MGIMESILDYKFLFDIGIENGEYKSFEDLKSRVRTDYRKFGISIINHEEKGNDYYNGVKKISRFEAITLIKFKTCSILDIKCYME